jgi:4-hydroxy-tetrahydrodipicolinate synthase
VPEPVGVIIPCVTVFDDGGELDLAATTSNIDWLIDAGVNALLVSGSCGEFSALEEHERCGLVEAAIEATDGRVPVFVGVMHTATAVAQRLARHAQQAGAAAVMSVPPYYSSGPEREVMQYFRDIAGAIEIPLIVYNNPGASGVALTVQTLGELATEGTTSMIKESHGDPTRIHDLRLVCPQSTRLIYGEDYGALEALLVGADGWVAGIGNIVPELAVGLYRAVSELDVAAARKLWFELLPLINMTSFKPMFGRVDERPDYIQIFKAGLTLRGRPGGLPRRPLLALPDADLNYLSGLLETLSVLPQGV